MSAILGTSVTGAGGPAAYTIDNSLRFRSSASAFLNRTPSVAGNRKTYTYSAWVKRGALSSYMELFSAGTALGNRTLIFFDAGFAGTNNITFLWESAGPTQYGTGTTAVFRDPSAWYHIVVSIDTTQATADNRVRIFVNGVQLAVSNAGSGVVPQNTDTNINSTNGHFISKSSYSADSYFDGYMTEINFIDGQALTPSSFGAINSSTGVWQPKAYTGSYGTNGFYLKFSNIATTSGSNTGLGRDFSGNGNFWNTNNISVTTGGTYDAMTDSPTPKSSTVANYPVLSPFFISQFGYAPSFANLRYLGSQQDDEYGENNATVALPRTGKWYFEALITSFDSDGEIRITLGPSSIVGTMPYYTNNGVIVNPGVGTQSVSPFGTSDVLGCGVDVDNNLITFYKNGVAQGTAISGKLVANTDYFFAMGGLFFQQVDVNFGQRPFAYAPPTGFKALNTFNLPTPTIGASATTLANKYFDATLYTGNNGTQNIVNSGAFKPDLVWTKSRASANNNYIYDSTRGVNKYLISNSTTFETTNSLTLISFNSNGYTLGSQDLSNISGNSVGWQWRANEGSTSTNTNGTLTSTVQVNATSGFSIVRFSNPDGSAYTVGHGLGLAPDFIVQKSIDGAGNWIVYSKNILPTQNLLMQTNGAVATALSWNNTAPTASVFSVAGLTARQRIAYCFVEKTGFSKFGAYTGNGNQNGPFIYTGFMPKFVMIKRTDSIGDWLMLDSVRNPFNVVNAQLLANSANAESAVNWIDILSNGFKLIQTGANGNASGGTYIYLAFAETPFNYSLAR